jgi:hypothetical protein
LEENIKMYPQKIGLGGEWTRLIWLREGQVAGSCE